MLRVVPLLKDAVTTPSCPTVTELTLPNGVPLVWIDCVTDAAENCVRAPEPVVPPMPNETCCAATPRLGAQFTAPAAGAAAAEAPMESVGLGGVPNSVVFAMSIVPSGLNAMMPDLIWPGARPEPDTTSEAGTAWISAYHWLA